MISFLLKLGVAIVWFFMFQALLMQVTDTDIEKGMKTPVVWDKYKKIINNAEGREVDNTFLQVK